MKKFKMSDVLITENILPNIEENIEMNVEVTELNSEEKSEPEPNTENNTESTENTIPEKDTTPEKDREKDTTPEKDSENIPNTEKHSAHGKNEKIENSIWEFLSLFSLFCFGCFVFYVFLPVKFHSSNKLWVVYADNCCNVMQNVTRCSFNHNCKKLLDHWIAFQNSTRDFYDCCYWYCPYKKWQTYPFCDPNCLRPKFF